MTNEDKSAQKRETLIPAPNITLFYASILTH